jgi:glycerol-3-phosphate cytidylyltransferase-like family protein
MEGGHRSGERRVQERDKDRAIFSEETRAACSTKCRFVRRIVLKRVINVEVVLAVPNSAQR